MHPVTTFARALFLVVSLTLPLAAFALDLKMITGSEKGVYYSVGDSISRTLAAEEIDEGVSITVTHSGGSVDNIRALDNHEADLALIQSDTLHKLKAGQLYEGDEKVDIDANKFVSLASLFPEYIQIIVRKNSDIASPLDLYEKNIYKGKDGSGTLANANDIIEFFNISDYTHALPKADTSVALTALMRGDIDVVFSTSARIIPFDPEYSSKLRLISIPSADIRKFSDKRYYYTLGKIGPDNNINIAYTRATLVARSPDANGLLNKHAEIIAKLVFDRQYEIAMNSPSGIPFFRDQMKLNRLPLDIHPGALKYYIDSGYYPSYTYLFITLAFLFLVASIIYLSHRGLNYSWARRIAGSRFAYQLEQIKPIHITWKFIYTLTSKHVPLSAIWILLLILVSLIIGILAVENGYSMDKDVPNPFAEQTFTDTLIWLLTFAVTGYSQGIYPNSFFGKVFAALIPLVGLGSILFVLIYENIQRHNRREKEARGIICPEQKDHFLVCGWNIRAPGLIRNLTSPNAPHGGRPVTVIADIPSEKPLDQFNFRKGYVYFLRGRSSEKKRLLLASAENAKSAIILADPHKVANGNIRGILTAAAVNSLRSPEAQKNPFVISELYYPKNEKYFHKSQVDKVVSLLEVSARILSHALVNPGISDLLLRILSFDSDQSAKLIPTPKKLVNTPFRQALQYRGETNGPYRMVLAAHRPDIPHESSSIELRFRDDSPYLLTGEHDDYTLKPQDMLLVIESGSYAASRKQNTHLAAAHSTPFLDGGRLEHLLIIGSDENAQPLIDAISHLFSTIVYMRVSPNTEPGQSDPHDRLTTIDVSEVSERSLQETHARLVDTTRVLVLGRSRLDDLAQLAEVDDDETMMRCLVVRRFFDNDPNLNNVHIAAELRMEENLHLFHDVGVAQAIPTNMIIELILAQMAFHGGRVSEFFLKAMDLRNPKSRLEKRPSGELSSGLLGLDFYTAADFLHQHNKQLLAVAKEDGRIITNPSPDSDDFDEKIGMEDYLFVFNRPD